MSATARWGWDGSTGTDAPPCPLCCCRGMPARFPAGRGDLANTVLRETRGGILPAGTHPDADPAEDLERPLCRIVLYNLRDLALDLWASFAVVAKYVLRLEALLACCVSVGSVLVYREYAEKLSANMNWTLVSFGVIFPLSMSIANGFKRRDQALTALLEIRGLLVNIMVAHCKWGRGRGGHERRHPRGHTAPEPQPRPHGEGSAPATPVRFTAADGKVVNITDVHIQEVHVLLSQIIDAMRQYLMVSRAARARAVYTTCGAEESRWVIWAEEVGGHTVTRLVVALHDATEVLRARGLPDGSTSRIAQFLTLLTSQWERVRALKEYRTPQAMRSFTRVFVHCLPIMYGPYFLFLAEGVAGTEDNIAFAAAISGIMTAFMLSLFFVQTSLENPFDPNSLDTVKVDLEMGRTQRLIDAVVADAAAVDWRRFTPTYPPDPDSIDMNFTSGVPQGKRPTPSPRGYMSGMRMPSTPLASL